MSVGGRGGGGHNITNEKENEGKKIEKILEKLCRVVRVVGLSVTVFVPGESTHASQNHLEDLESCEHIP